MDKDNNSPFQEPRATELANMRLITRRLRRITYDCLNAAVRGDSVVCKLGHTFPSIGKRREEGLPLLAVLRGRSSGACRECSDYDGEDNE